MFIFLLISYPTGVLIQLLWYILTVQILCKAREKDINSSLVFLSCPKYDIRLNCRQINSVYGAKHCSRKHSDLASGATTGYCFIIQSHTANEFNVDICSTCCLWFLILFLIAGSLNSELKKLFNTQFRCTFLFAFIQML